MDINGDGLPDRIFKQNGALYYQANRTGTFGEAIKIEGISEFSKVSSNNWTVGGSTNAGFYAATVSAGISETFSFTNRSIYFSDVNNDGLPDLVSDGTVYFNHIVKDAQGNLKPVFTQSSADTPSPIKGGGVIDISGSEVDPQEQADKIASAPLYDVVRMWEAPFKGKIKIEGSVQLLAPQEGYDAAEYAKADGVRVAIQIKGTEKWSKKIEKGDHNVYPASVTPTDSIHKGDRIYFRLQSGDSEMANGAFDQVEWNPVITYTATDSIADTDTTAVEQLSISNADGQKMYRFPAAEAAVYPQSGVTRVANYSAILYRYIGDRRLL